MIRGATKAQYLPLLTTVLVGLPEIKPTWLQAQKVHGCQFDGSRLVIFHQYEGGVKIKVSKNQAAAKPPIW